MPRSRDDALLLANQLCFALHSTAHAMTRAYKPLLAALGLTYPQWLVMLVLWEEDGPTVSALGDRLHLDSGTLTPLLKRLEGNGLVRRARDRADERQVRIALTPRGRALRDKALAVRSAIGCASGLDEQAVQRLKDELTALRDRLDGRPG